jgi:hypothetical protein
MIKALFYKEWTKTKKIVIFLLIALLSVSVYIIIDKLRIFKLVGIVHITDVIVNKNTFIFSILKYLPLAVGAILAVAQFYIEYANRRFKLSLHLPLPENKLVSILVCYGVTILATLFFIQLLLLGIFIDQHFAHEIAVHYIYTMIPWYCAGFASYALVSMVSLEPNTLRKFTLSLFSIAYLYFFFMSDTAGSYMNLVLFTIIYSLVPYVFIYLSAWRLKKGE